MFPKIVLLAGVAIGFYYFASPYQNCMRDLSYRIGKPYGNDRSVSKARVIEYCSQATDW
jgi:hypothetical protein